MTLAEFQRQMAADVMRPLTDGGNMSRVSRAGEYVKPNDRLNGRERLEIYNRQYWYRILDSLWEDFPGLRAIVGDGAFERICRGYLTDHPSQSFTMRDLGCNLEGWLRRRPAYGADRQALALDMVRLEWAHIVAFDGPAEKPLGPEDLLELSPALRMNLQPHITLLDLHHPVDDLRIRISRDADLHAPASNAVPAPKHSATKRRSAPRRKASIFVAVHRQHDSVYYRRLAREEFKILNAIKMNDPIRAAIDAGFRGSSLSAEGYQTRIGEWFSVWAELGWLCRRT
jgi:hypothetical protein